MADHLDFSFLRRPVWLVGHIVALVATVGFALLGMWQLDRHDERSRLDSALEARLSVAPVALDALVQDTGGAPSAMEYRRVVLAGTYVVAEEVILQARSLDGRSGHEVLTPLVVGDGSAVIVDRGWVPIDTLGPPVAVAAPPDGQVEVVGYVRQTQVRSGLGPVDPPDGRLDRISRVDLARLQAQTDLELQEVWVQLAEQVPPQEGLPLLVAPPQPGEGPPHLSYAMQWFAFAGIVLVSYPVLLYRTARRARP